MTLINSASTAAISFWMMSRSAYSLTIPKRIVSTAGEQLKRVRVHVSADMNLRTLTVPTATRKTLTPTSSAQSAARSFGHPTCIITCILSVFLRSIFSVNDCQISSRTLHLKSALKGESGKISANT